LKEFLRILNKFGLTPIEALDKPFDPAVHHAMSIVEREDVKENRVVEVFRKGYMFRDKVIRAPLVGVSKKPSEGNEEEEIEIIEEES
jgi:molecular chaperone GrpE